MVMRISHDEADGQADKGMALRPRNIFASATDTTIILITTALVREGLKHENAALIHSLRTT